MYSKPVLAHVSEKEKEADRKDGYRARNVDDLIERDVARVLYVLDLLAVPRGLLERLKDQCGSRGHNNHGGHTVLANELASHTHTLVVLCRLGNVITNLLGGLHKFNTIQLVSTYRNTLSHPCHRMPNSDITNRITQCVEWPHAASSSSPPHTASMQ